MLADLLFEIGGAEIDAKIFAHAEEIPHAG
jgi:hypothetical protein